MTTRKQEEWSRYPLGQTYDLIYPFNMVSEHGHDAPVITEEVFRPAEIKKIIKYAKTAQWERYEYTKPTYRSVLAHQLKVTGVMSWVYDRIANHLVRVNDETFQYHLTGMREPVTLRKYEVGDVHEPHTDYINADTSKLSVVVPLSKPGTYEGGELQVFGYDLPEIPLGGSIVFPGWRTHSVSPVTKGERLALLAWAVGPRLV